MSSRSIRDQFPVKPPRVRGAKHRDYIQSQIKLYELALAAIADGVIVTEHAGKATYLNPAAEKMLGRTLASVRGESVLSAFCDEHGVPAGERLLAQVMDSAELRRERYHLRRADGALVPVELNVSGLEIQGVNVRVIATFRDFTRELAQQERLEEQALTDRLTGCYNRWWFDSAYEQALRQAEERGSDVALIFIDLDNFKKFNDQSFIFGDELIQKAAETIRSVLRPEDKLVRLGGDEFVLLLEGVDWERTVQIAERILAALPRLDVRLPRSPETRFRLTASIGLAVLNGLDRRLPNLCAYAEEAKRFAKESGRDRICVQPEGSILEPALH